MRLDASADEIKTARELVADRLRAWGCGSSVEVARVLTSELVANAVMHGRAPISVSVRRLDGAVRVEVTDEGDGHPARRSIDFERPGGMGLVIVSTLATRWGVVPAPTGKMVWFELATV